MKKYKFSSQFHINVIKNEQAPYIFKVSAHMPKIQNKNQKTTSNPILTKDEIAQQLIAKIQEFNPENVNE